MTGRILAALYLTWVGVGLVVGYHQLAVPGASGRAMLWLVHDLDDRVTLHGDVLRRSARELSNHAFVRGPGEVRIHQRRPRPRRLVLELAFAGTGAGPGGGLTVHDPTGGGRWHAGLVHAWRTEISVPIGRGTERLGLAPDDPRLRYRITGARLTAARTPPRPFAARALRGPSVTSAGVRVSLGSGWDAGAMLSPQQMRDPRLGLRSGPRAYLILDTESPGRYRLTLPAELLAPGGPAPQIALDGRPVELELARSGDGILADLRLGRHGVLAIRLPAAAAGAGILLYPARLRLRRLE